MEEAKKKKNEIKRTYILWIRPAVSGAFFDLAFFCLVFFSLLLSRGHMVGQQDAHFVKLYTYTYTPFLQVSPKLLSGLVSARKCVCLHSARCVSDPRALKFYSILLGVDAVLFLFVHLSFPPVTYHPMFFFVSLVDEGALKLRCAQRLMAGAGVCACSSGCTARRGGLPGMKISRVVCERSGRLSKFADHWLRGCGREGRACASSRRFRCLFSCCCWGVCVWVETCVGLVLRVRTGMQTYIRWKSGGLLCCDVGLGGEVYACV